MIDLAEHIESACDEVRQIGRHLDIPDYAEFLAVVINDLVVDLAACRDDLRRGRG